MAASLVSAVSSDLITPSVTPCSQRAPCPRVPPVPARRARGRRQSALVARAGNQSPAAARPGSASSPQPRILTSCTPRAAFAGPSKNLTKKRPRPHGAPQKPLRDCTATTRSRCRDTVLAPLVSGCLWTGWLGVQGVGYHIGTLGPPLHVKSQEAAATPRSMHITRHLHRAPVLVA